MKTDSKPGSASRVAAVAVCAMTLLPLFKANHWSFRIFDFPRIQVAVLGLAALAGMQSRAPSPSDRRLKWLLGAAIIGQLLQIRRYTVFSTRQVKRATAQPAEQKLRIMVANVLMTNRKIDLLSERVAQRNPDLLILLEPDRWWTENLDFLKEHYPYRVEHPQNNTYGILIYSKLKVLKPDIQFLVHPEVPSVRCQVQMRNGDLIWLYVVHPKPPGRITRHGEIRGTAPRDAELVLVAEDLKNKTEPVVVAGDFNDVAWSHTTRRFQRIGRLLDPRIGRGLYSTFHASHPLLRFPLDHLFHSEHFKLGEFGRERYIGSDHFPIFAELSLEPEAPLEQEPPRPHPEDEIEARDELKEIGLEHKNADGTPSATRAQQPSGVKATS